MREPDPPLAPVVGFLRVLQPDDANTSCSSKADLDVHARARDDAHADELEKLGAHVVVPELVATGVKLAGSILDAMDEGIAEETW